MRQTRNSQEYDTVNFVIDASHKHTVVINRKSSNEDFFSIMFKMQ